MKFLSQMWKKILFCFILTLAITVGSFIYVAKAEQTNNNRFYHINLSEETIVKGYTVNAFDGALKLSLTPGVLNKATGIEAIELNEKIDLPWQLEKISKVYQFELKNKSSYDGKKPFYIQLSYDKQSDYYKQVFYYDKNYSSWQPLPTVDYSDKSFARALIRLPFARLAVFANKEALVAGEASWYKHKNGLFAASPDFPKKSKLRVYNINNNKYIDVVVNDFGPNRKVHSSRVIDLDKVAFKKIAPAGAGVINVRIEPLYIAPENNKILGISLTGAKSEFNISAKSAIVMDEKTGDILWQKNVSSILPIASLTKLVAVKVFLDTRPSLNQAVVYSVKDEEYNYKYANKFEIARLKLNDGDALTIENLIYSALVGSANNTVETLVRISGLSREEFINRMNIAAAGWGATDTHFVEPTGLSSRNVSSALDYAIMIKQVCVHPIIRKASVMAKYSFKTINTQKYHIVKNTDKLINTSSLKITGSKTGYLNEALYCLMVRVEKDSMGPLIVVTLGTPNRAQSFEETENLAKYALNELNNKSQIENSARKNFNVAVK